MERTGTSRSCPSDQLVIAPRRESPSDTVGLSPPVAVTDPQTVVPARVRLTARVRGEVGETPPVRVTKWINRARMGDRAPSVHADAAGLKVGPAGR